MLLLIKCANPACSDQHYHALGTPALFSLIHDSSSVACYETTHSLHPTPLLLVPFLPPLPQNVHRLSARCVRASAQFGWRTGNNGLLQRLIQSHRNANHAYWRQPHMVCVARSLARRAAWANNSKEALSVLPHAACHTVVPVTKAIRCTCPVERISLGALPAKQQAGWCCRQPVPAGRRFARSLLR